MNNLITNIQLKSKLAFIDSLLSCQVDLGGVDELSVDQMSVDQMIRYRTVCHRQNPLAAW